MIVAREHQTCSFSSTRLFRLSWEPCSESYTLSPLKTCTHTCESGGLWTGDGLLVVFPRLNRPFISISYTTPLWLESGVFRMRLIQKPRKSQWAYVVEGLQRWCVAVALRWRWPSSASESPTVVTGSQFAAVFSTPTETKRQNAQNRRPYSFLRLLLRTTTDDDVFQINWITKRALLSGLFML